MSRGGRWYINLENDVDLLLCISLLIYLAHSILSAEEWKFQPVSHVAYIIPCVIPSSNIHSINWTKLVIKKILTRCTQLAGLSSPSQTSPVSLKHPMKIYKFTKTCYLTYPRVYSVFLYILYSRRLLSDWCISSVVNDIIITIYL